jgi:hypothetical protein
MKSNNLKLNRNGYEWYPYTVEFESPDGVFIFGIWAISDEHAELQCQAIRETATLRGRLLSESAPSKNP